LRRRGEGAPQGVENRGRDGRKAGVNVKDVAEAVSELKDKASVLQIVARV